MSRWYIIILLATTMTVGFCIAQSNQAVVVEDFKPSSINQPGKQFPQVNSEGRVRASILAPDAKKVLLDIGGVKYDMTKTYITCITQNDI